MARTAILFGLSLMVGVVALPLAQASAASPFAQGATGDKKNGDAADCLTPGQVTTVKKIYGGVKMKDGKEKAVMPVSTAEYNPGGWRALLNTTTISLGMQNVFDEDPPFVASASENGYDESLATIKGRFWYVQLKKRF